MEVGDVAAGRDLYAYLVGVGRLEVVLGDSLSHLGGGDADYGIGVGVVIGNAVEDLDAEQTLFELSAAAD